MTRPDTPIDDDRLMAHADGELSGAAAAAVAQAIAADPDMARRHAAFVATRARLADLAAADGPVPAALQARVADLVAAHLADRTGAGIAEETGEQAGEQTGEQAGEQAVPPAGAQVVPLRRWRRPAPVWAVPLAASVALAVGLGAGLLMPGGVMSGGAGGVSGGAAGPSFDSAAVQAALGRLATGDTAAVDGGALRIVGSFRDAADQLCREAVLSPAAGDAALAVLCRAPDGGWQAELVLRQPAEADSGALAAASGTGAVDAFLGDIGAGPALDPTAEAQALAE